MTHIEKKKNSLKLRHVVVVEGKSDAAAIRRSVVCECIITHGFKLRESLLKRMEEAEKRVGIIVLTDPDFVGEGIRKKIAERIPTAAHAFISQEDAVHGKDIGVENASDDVLRHALLNARKRMLPHEASRTVSTVSMEDLYRLGLTGSEDAARLRNQAGKILGIGYANTKRFLSRIHFLYRHRRTGRRGSAGATTHARRERKWSG